MNGFEFIYNNNFDRIYRMDMIFSRFPEETLNITSPDGESILMNA